MEQVEKDLYDTIFDDDWNQDEFEDNNPEYNSSLVISPRDWTVETIVNQIKQGNIDLDPTYQRRNVWNDKKRSKLIESLMLGIPVPEIILAEDREKKGSFVVIDGKQRLLTLTGFLRPKAKPFWSNPRLVGLEVLKSLNGKTFAEIQSELKLGRQLLNASIRCSFITNYPTEDVLYDIFYRLNTGSVPLSTQELRQVLHRGPFAQYLIEITNKAGQPLHRVMELHEPDIRLRDAEIILRFIAIFLFNSEYNSNLKGFLDDSMGRINKEWDKYQVQVEEIYRKFNLAIDLLIDVFGSNRFVGRKWTNGKYERRFNKVLLEVEVFYFFDLIGKEIDSEIKDKFRQSFTELSSNLTFRNSIEASTKDKGAYSIRFEAFGNLVRDVFNVKVRQNPFRDE